MPTLRHQILIDANPRAIWNAVTTSEGAAGWWADEVRIDARVGGRVVLVHGEGEHRQEEVGTVMQARPTAVFEVRWDGASLTRGTSTLFQIGRADNDTKIHVVQSGAGILDDEAASAVLLDLWKERFVRLRKTFEGA
jgi:uncharacterized protein YndB with AHSA1/START domain